eukprot:1840887-Ditylum_brightwellii.AAC.1
MSISAYPLCFQGVIDGNPIGHAHDNTLLGTCQYLIEFGDSEVTELTASPLSAPPICPHKQYKAH